MFLETETSIDIPNLNLGALACPHLQGVQGLMAHARSLAPAPWAMATPCRGAVGSLWQVAQLETTGGDMGLWSNETGGFTGKNRGDSSFVSQQGWGYRGYLPNMKYMNKHWGYEKGGKKHV